MSDSRSAPASGPSGQGARRRSPWTLYLLIAVCLSPVLASYLFYYVIPPSGQTNYGTLIEPQRPMPPIAARVDPTPAAAGAAQPAPANSATAPARTATAPASTTATGLSDFRGRWILLAVNQGACDRDCAEKLFFMRQTHVSLGKERERLVRVLLVTDDTPLPAAIVAAHPDLTVMRVDPRELAGILPVDAQTTLSDHLYLIDPLHNLMMQFPKDPDPAGTRKDLQRLMKASRIG